MPANVSDQSSLTDGGSFDIIRNRLLTQSTNLRHLVTGLNQQRIQEFGQSDMKLMHRAQIRTENNCIARDIVQIGDLLLFGYNVFIGLKSELLVSDVFAIYKAQVTESSLTLQQQPIESSFLSDHRFQQDFTVLYQYYKHTKLVQLMVRNEKLLAAFQIGERINDLRVFRWQLKPSGDIESYIDNRGERDIELPPSHDFQWTAVGRENYEIGQFPHINIMNEIFVETTGGDLTIKIENNTATGEGIYSEPVNDDTQSIDDAQFYFSRVGRLILLKIKPYREDQWRYFVFNRDLVQVLRIDAIGVSCVSLPEDHGIVFPGGYYLNSGQSKLFEDDIEDFRFKRMLMSPNGEDVLYIFYKPTEGKLGLLTYNMIEKKIQNPIYGHGYAKNENGQIFLISSEVEPTRVHPVQLWSTPFYSAEYMNSIPSSGSFLAKIGNSELVRGISDIFSLCRCFESNDVHEGLYIQARKKCDTLFDSYFWLKNDDFKLIYELIVQLKDSIRLVLDEFQKVKSIRQDSAQALQELRSESASVQSQLDLSLGDDPQVYANLLDRFRKLRGRCMSVSSLRYVDQNDINELDEMLKIGESKLAKLTLNLLDEGSAFATYDLVLQDIAARLVPMQAVSEIDPLIKEVEIIAGGLDVLSELVASLEAEDTQLKTRIIEQLSIVYSKVNQCRAATKNKRNSVNSFEAKAEFSAQLSLLAQSVDYALSQSDTPDATDHELAKLLVQLESLETRMSEHDEFIADIMTKRDMVMATFENHKQQLVDAQQQKALRLSDAATRMLKNIEKKSFRITTVDDLNSYFASDAMVLKLKTMIQSLFGMNASVQAEDIHAQLKFIENKALRLLRDSSELYQDGGKSITLGQHQFSVNQQELDVVIMIRNETQFLHLTSTDYFEKIQSKELLDYQDLWSMSLRSESTCVYRAEYLAFVFIQALEAGRVHDIRSPDKVGQNTDNIGDRVTHKNLLPLITQFASSRYSESYVRGVHDHDAAKIAQCYMTLLESANGMEFPSISRALAAFFYRENQQKSQMLLWHELALAAAQLHTKYSHKPLVDRLVESIKPSINAFIDSHDLQDIDPKINIISSLACEYLVQVLMINDVSFTITQKSIEAIKLFKNAFTITAWNQFEKTLRQLKDSVGEQWYLCRHWLTPWIQSISDQSAAQHMTPNEDVGRTVSYDIDEIVMYLILDSTINFNVSAFDDVFNVDGLLGDHPILIQHSLRTSLSHFRLKLGEHCNQVIPRFEHYQSLRQKVLDQARIELNLQSFKAKPLSSFVRNRLINEAYLPIIGDNFAKQIGASGAKKRTDLMGLLMIISPPGYGKTTLMEYVADRLGLIFMKINCPALGHDVVSLDAAQAQNATAQQELIKLNLSLEMGNNVMLYLDDIQHTNPEFLQKFISLCDGTRRIEGVWKGKTKTYDMRGKKFCVVMAGNPYTESGALFKIPDMLANRADIYNLGDVLGGMEEQFSLSYIENALTSNQILSRLALGDMADVYTLIKMARGRTELASELKQSISSEEQNEMILVLEKMFKIQDIILKINKEYIASAAQNDQYRVEPPFKLQGSYRNMNKLTEKITAVMSDPELDILIHDHYIGESQLLTNGSEDNILKLKKLRGILKPDESKRWQQICDDFLRNKALGGSDTDVGQKVVVQLADLVKSFNDLSNFAINNSAMEQARSKTQARNHLTQQLKFQKHLETLVATLQQVAVEIHKSAPEIIIPPVPEPHIQVINQPIPGITILLETLAATIENTIYPLVRSLDKKLEIDIEGHRKLKAISRQLQELADNQASNSCSQPRD